LKFNLIVVDDLDLNGLDAVVVGHFLVFAGVVGEFALIDTDIVKSIIEKFIAADGIFFEQVMKVALGVVVGWWKVFGKKDFNGQWFRQGRYHPLAGVGNGVNFVGRQIRSEKQGDAGDVYQRDNNEVDDEFKILA
jgi:hypothetical protein